MNGGSGSGGFYKYRCKYFYTYNCSNWVYVSNAPCANCLAEGRDSAEAQIQTSNKPREVQVPYYDDQGMLQYSLMEFVPEDQSGPYWTVRQKVTASTNPQQQPQLYRMAATTSDQPRAPIYASATVLQGHA